MFERDPAVQALLAKIPLLGFYPAAPDATSKYYPRTMWDEADKHVTIGGSGKVDFGMDTANGMDWMNNDAIYQNMTTNCYIFLQVTVSPVIQQGGTTINGTRLYIGENNPPDICVSAYWGTNIWSQSAFSRGMVTAWIPPGWYYGIYGSYSGQVDWVIRYYLPDPGGDNPPPVQ